MSTKTHGKVYFGNPDRQDYIGREDDGTFKLSFRGVALMTATAAGVLASAALGTQVPATDDTYDLGTTLTKWRNAYIDGTAYIDAIESGVTPFVAAGLPAAQGGSVQLKGGTSSTSGNAGGAASLTGGVPGATGVGGAASVTGGIGGATSGAGGAVAITGGAGTAGNANGGNVILAGGALQGSGKTGLVVMRSRPIRPAGTPTAKTTTAAITAAELFGGIITTTGATAPSVHQLPTGTLLLAELPGLAADDSFDFFIINTGVGATTDATITVNTDITIIGNPTIGSLVDATQDVGSATFRARYTGGVTWIVYRIA